MRQLFVFLFLGTIWSSCQQNKHAVPENLPVDFQVFYELFHRDSSYQMEHIVFPLEGLPDYAQPEQLMGQKYYWDELEWKLHKNWGNEATDFRKSFSMPSPIMVVERLIHLERALMTERRFAKMGEEWFLIYYAGINTYSKSPAN